LLVFVRGRCGRCGLHRSTSRHSGPMILLIAWFFLLMSFHAFLFFFFSQWVDGWGISLDGEHHHHHQHPTNRGWDPEKCTYVCRTVLYAVWAAFPSLSSMSRLCHAAVFVSRTRRKGELRRWRGTRPNWQAGRHHPGQDGEIRRTEKLELRGIIHVRA
jgi:ABC-type Fe3+ transport system permease subunit